MFFSKATYQEIELPFITDVYSNWKQDEEAGIVNIEAYGTVAGEYKYCYTSYTLKKHFMYDNGDYEQMIELLKHAEGKLVKIRFKFKNNKLKDFQLLTDSLAEAYHDERFLQLELVGWELHDKSCREISFS
ncbi:MAG: hypothetical protein K2I93_01280 [Oscillospiraceae bacterium]|nr:hypothetical protein [Oscillospiraceae bacterium]